MRKLAVLLLLFFCLQYGFSQKDYFEGILIVKTKDINLVKAKLSELLKISSKEITFKKEFILNDNYESELLKAQEKYAFDIPDISNIYRITYNQTINPLDLSRIISKWEFVEYCEPLYKVQLLYVPDDPMNSTDQYWLEKIHAYEAWDIHRGDTNTIIGISDTGIDFAHPDLINNIKTNYSDLVDGVDNDNDGYVDNIRGWNFAEDNNDAQSNENPHGTYVSGIAGASTDNGIGVSGAGFDCKLLPLKIMNSDGIIENSYQSIVYAALHSCDVINCSWGSTYFQQMGQDVVTYAALVHDLLIVAAAGNTDSDIKYYPASYENVMSVAATTINDERWSPENTPTGAGSSYSYDVDISAPGAMFKSTDLGGGYTLMWGGTSFAAPIVSGAAAVVRSFYPQLSSQQIIAHLKNTSDLIDTIEYNIPYANKLGKGRINFYRALTEEFTPAVVFRDYNIIEDENSLTLNGKFVNYLSTAENLNVSVSIESAYASLENSEIAIGDLEELQVYESNGEIIINKSSDIPYDYTIILRFEYNANNYSDVQFITFISNSSYKNIYTDKFSLSITPNGRIGYSDINSSIGEGLLYDNVFSLFYDCGIISGTSVINLKSSVRQATDFKNISYPQYIFDDGNFLNHCRVNFDDSLDINPSGLQYIGDFYSWAGEQNKSFIIADYKIINNSVYDCDNFYFGIFTDWDLINPSQNSILFIPEHQFMCIKSDASQTMYAGIKVLSDQNVLNYFVPQIDGGDGVIDLTDGMQDIERFYIISNNVVTTDLSLSTDFAASTSVGPFNIPSGDTAIIGMAIIATDNLYDLNQALERSSLLYNSELYPENIHSSKFQYPKVFPNPVSDYLFIESSHDLVFNIYYEIYSIDGILIHQEQVHNNKIDVKHLSPGIYLLKLFGINNEILHYKFIKSN